MELIGIDETGDAAAHVVDLHNARGGVKSFVGFNLEFSLESSNSNVCLIFSQAIGTGIQIVVHGCRQPRIIGGGKSITGFVLLDGDPGLTMTFRLQKE